MRTPKGPLNDPSDHPRLKPLDVAAGPEGWIRYRYESVVRPDTLVEVLAQVVEEEHAGADLWPGRLTVRRVVVTNQLAGVGAAVLRELPIGQIEAWANRPDVSDKIFERIDHPAGLDFAALGRKFGRTEKLEDNDGGEPKYVITHPEGVHADYGDAFYERVAAVYGAAAAREKAPAKAIARDSGLEDRLSLVYRWIKEARRRELLPKGRPGKAG